MELAPIIVFGYNRPEHYQRTLDALCKNGLASESVLFLYCDGAKDDASSETLAKIAEVRTIAHAQHWAKETYVIEASYNKGLAESIIDGVTEVIRQYGRVIVLEDDLVTSSGFLQYMNNALDFYQNEERVMHVTGYMYPHKWPLPETFFYEVPHCWGWGTWERAWQYFSNDAEGLYNYWKGDWNTFDKFGSNVLSEQLISNYNGSLNTWFVKWYAVVLMKNGLALYPGKSLVLNDGFNKGATNCHETHLFDVTPVAHVDVCKIPIKSNKRAAKIIYDVYQGHWYNKRRREAFFKKIMNMFRLCQ